MQAVESDIAPFKSEWRKDQSDPDPECFPLWARKKKHTEVSGRDCIQRSVMHQIQKRASGQTFWGGAKAV